MTALKNFLNIYLNEVGDSCVGYTYKPMIKQLRETSLTSDNCVYGGASVIYIYILPHLATNFSKRIANKFQIVCWVFKSKIDFN